MIPTHPFMELNYIDVSIELVYTLLIIVLCFVVYIKTKEIYELSLHKGIKYFRLAFLVFGIAYFFRFASLLFMITNFPEMRMMFLGFIPVAIASSLAIIFLTYSTLSKKIQWNTAHEISLFCIIAVAISLLVFLTRSPGILLLSQIVLFFIAIFTLYGVGHKKESMKQLRVVYLLLFIFWIFNISMLFGPGSEFIHVPFIPYARAVLYCISALIFSYITYKVLKTIQ